MNIPKALAVLSLVGALATGALVYVAQPGSQGELADAGVMACPAIDAICPARRPKDGGGFEYARIRTAARDCRADGLGIVLRPAPGGGEWFRVDLCQKAAVATLASENDSADEPFDCACSSGALCTVTHPTTGLQVPAPLGRTFGPGYRIETFAGPGCVPKSCAGVFGGAGDETWPAGCP